MRSTGAGAPQSVPASLLMMLQRDLTLSRTFSVCFLYVSDLNAKKTVATCFHLDNKQAARKLKVTLAGDVLVHDFAPKYLGVTHIQCNTMHQCELPGNYYDILA